MPDELPDDAWVQSFISAPPRHLLTTLQRRLQASNTHVHALAELYKQRALIESQYADSLSKLARTAESGGLNGKQGTEWDRSGGESKIWESLVNDLVETSSAHSTFASILKADFEQPIRELPSKLVHWRRIGDQESSLDKTLKDYEKTAGKLDKASTKQKSSKADALSSELDQITQSLSSLTPMVYTTFQKLDEERLRVLKEVIVRWATARGDLATRDGERAERTVSSLLGWETQDEVLAVGRRLGGGGSVPSIRGNGNVAPSPSRRLSSVTSQSNDFSPRPAPPRQTSSQMREGSGTGFSGIKSMLGRKSTVMKKENRARSGSIATSTRSARDGPDTMEEEAPAPSNLVDNEGFSIPPADRHRNLWEEPETPIDSRPAPAQNFTASPNESHESLESPAPQSRLNLALAPAPIQESEEERQTALAKMQQTLQMPSQPSRRSTIARGRRDVRNTMFGGDMAELSPQPTGTLQPFRQSSVSSNNPFDSPSVPAASGLSSSVMATSTDPGLRASITETVNVIMKAGNVERIQINGEIHLALRSAVQSGPIHLRLDRFEHLEKIAPNPAFLAQVPDKAGEYFLNSEVLAAATSSSKGTLLFKYQVHVAAGKESEILPLRLEPAFSCKDGETRMILNYHVNSASPLQQLSNVALFATFGQGPSVSHVQAKPAGGVWSSASRHMTWKLGDVSTDGKIIAKFTTEPGEIMTPQGVQASWAAEGVLSSGIGIEIAAGDWKFEEVKKGVTTGKYFAEAVVN